MEHPLRLAILRAAAEPRSATEIAAGLGYPRQRINYHIGRLRRAGFLIPAERRRRRGLYEQRYWASATAYVVAPEALGPVGCRPTGWRIASAPSTSSPSPRRRRASWARS